MPTKVSQLPQAVGFNGEERVLVVQDGVSKTLPVSAVQGPQGDQGPQGIQGLQGIQGATGDQGPQGEVGPQGDPGDLTSEAEALLEEIADLSEMIAAIAASGQIYKTKALLVAAIGTIDADAYAIVLKDESVGDHAMIYQKSAGALVAELDLSSGAPPAFASITGAPGDNAALAAALAVKAPLASPAFTDNPTAPTQPAGNNSTRLATTAFVAAALAALLNSAPAQLDTLKELADALGNDANYAATVTAALATKLAVNGGTATNLSLIGALTEDIYAIPDAAGFAIDPTNGALQTITLGANRTPTVANFAAGQYVVLAIDDGSARTITWSTISVVWLGSGAPTLAATGKTWIVLWRVGATYFGRWIGDSPS